MRLEGKVGIVTGSGSGIGQAIALRLAGEGADIVVADCRIQPAERVAKEIMDLGRQSFAVQVDVSNYNQANEMAEKSLEKFDKIDILVNNAGIYPSSRLVDMTESEWDKVMSINLKGAFNCTKAVLSSMIEQGSGKIVNMSSVTGTLVSHTGMAHYSASKAGILGFTKALALEVSQYEINVNAVAPGYIDTPGVRREEKPEHLEQIARSIPLKRLGLPVDVANAVLFLVSDDSKYITGQMLVVDGGNWIQELKF